MQQLTMIYDVNCALLYGGDYQLYQSLTLSLVIIDAISFA